MSLLFTLPTYISLILFAVSRPVFAAPAVNISIASQLPPVGRVGVEYAFTLFTDTFTESSLTYTATGLPAWLIFDTDLLFFEGTPATADLGLTEVTITASDGTNEVSDLFDVFVTDQPSPAVHLGFESQIANPALHEFSSATALPSNTGVLLHPYYSFSLGFQYDTFRPAYDASSDHQQIFYSAHVRDTGALPSWLVYDNTTNTFSGVAPSTGSWTVVVVGSDYWGFDAVQDSFLIEVGTDYFDLIEGKDSLDNITTVAGDMVEYSLNLSSLTLDGQAVATQDLAVSVDLAQYSWLSYDSATMSISGTTPADYVNGSVTNQYIPLAITSVGNSSNAVINLWIALFIEPSLFTTLTIPNATATPGTTFSFSLVPFLRNTSEVASANISSTASTALSSWLVYNPASYMLSGNVPNASALTSAEFRTLLATDATLPITITATDVSGLTSTAALQIVLSGVASTTTATTPGSTGTAGATGTTATGASSSSGLSTGAKIALAVVFGLLGLLLLCLLLFCCCRRRRREKKEKVVEDKPRHSTGGDSFDGIVTSPRSPKEGFFAMPFGLLGAKGQPDMPHSESAKLQLGEIPRFSSIYIHRPSNAGEQSRPELADLEAETSQQPRQLGAIKGILNWGGITGNGKSEISQPSFPPLSPPSPAQGEIINGANLEIPGDLSDFSHDLTSGSSGDRASWESRGSFQWSSQEISRPRVLGADGRPVSGAPSMPRPRQDFTPRYPRNASPTALGRLVRPPSEAISVGRDFSEFDHSHETHSDSLTGTHSGSASHSFLTGSGSSSHPSSDSVPRSPARQVAGFTAGPSGLGRIIGNTTQFPPVNESDEDPDGYMSESSAVVTRAQRQALIDGASAEGVRAPRMMASKERFAHSPTEAERPDAARTPSEEAMRGDAEAFDDADEDIRRPESTAYAPSAITDLQGLGYPAEAIYFGSPEQKGKNANPTPAVSPPPGARNTSIRQVKPPAEVILSPPLPQIGSLMQTLHQTRKPLRTSNITMVEGRYIAQSNESFNLHPQLNPRPQVSLSASTWSAPAPSTYRAESADGSPLPAWLHWDAKELELWGIPSLSDAGQWLEVRIIEKMPTEKRKSNDSSLLVPRTFNEREVGKCTIEIVEGMRSPDAFSLDGYGSPSAENP